MAVLSFIPGIKAQILINGEAAPEIVDQDPIKVDHPNHDVVQHQTARTVSNYIESKTGQEFSIKCSVRCPPYRMDSSKLCFHIYVDGKLGWILICERAPFERRGHTKWEGEAGGVKEGKGRSCKEYCFLFAKIETTSDQLSFTQTNREAQRMRKVGMIEIRVYRTTFGKPGGPTAWASKNGFFKRQGEKVPEKATKGDAKSHATALKQGKKVKRGLVARVELKDGEDYPIVIFKFMYRSNEALKQMHVIKRTPSPSRSPSPDYEERDANGHTAAQRRVMEQALKKLRCQQAARREGKVNSSQTAAGVKRAHVKLEPGLSKSIHDSDRVTKRPKPHPSPTPKALPVETIDLISDEEFGGNELFM